MYYFYFAIILRVTIKSLSQKGLSINKTIVIMGIGGIVSEGRSREDKKFIEQLT